MSRHARQSKRDNYRRVPQSESLPEEIKSMVTAEDYSADKVQLLTHTKLQDDGTYEIFQEVNKVVPNSQGLFEILRTMHNVDQCNR